MRSGMLMMCKRWTRTNIVRMNLWMSFLMIESRCGRAFGFGLGICLLVYSGFCLGAGWVNGCILSFIEYGMQNGFSDSKVLEFRDEHRIRPSGEIDTISSTNLNNISSKSHIISPVHNSIAVS